MNSTISWPQGKRFAFTVFDDTDAATLHNIEPVYRFLRDEGILTTKSCWAIPGDPDRGRYPGQTCEDPDYAAWLLELQRQGFEIGWHNTTWHGMPRPSILAALDRFESLFGHNPSTGTNHSPGESIYWGDARLSGWRVPLYDLMTLYRERGVHLGHVEKSEYFWGDLCRQRIKYYRNFVYRDINTLKACPEMPYYDPLKPYVRAWFASSDGQRLPGFTRCLSEANQDRLEEEGGACIMYTHFACGFAENGRLEPRFASVMKRLAKKNGWFVPVGTLLAHLEQQQGLHEITTQERQRLETRWLLEKVRYGPT